MTEASQVQPTQPWYADLVKNVSDNPAQVVWPTDEHGTTSELKKAFAVVSMKIKGNKAKEDVLIATLMVGLAHIRKRVKKDAAVQAERIKRINQLAEARKPLERFSSHITTNTGVSDVAH